MTLYEKFIEASDNAKLFKKFDGIERFGELPNGEFGGVKIVLGKHKATEMYAPKLKITDCLEITPDRATNLPPQVILSACDVPRLIEKRGTTAIFKLPHGEASVFVEDSERVVITQIFD